MTTAKTYLRLKLNPHDNLNVLQKELYLAVKLICHGLNLMKSAEAPFESDLIIGITRIIGYFCSDSSLSHVVAWVLATEHSATPLSAPHIPRLS